MKQMKLLVCATVFIALMSMGASAYTWVNRTVTVQNIGVPGGQAPPIYNATLWAYTTSGKSCTNIDGFNPFSAKNITFFSTEENIPINQGEFCHPLLPNILVEFACPTQVRVNGVLGTQFPRYPGLFLFDCGSIGMKCGGHGNNKCVKK